MGTEGGGCEKIGRGRQVLVAVDPRGVPGLQGVEFGAAPAVGCLYHGDRGARRRWRFLGHVLRMPPDRVAPWVLRQSYASEGGRRKRGAPPVTWVRLVKREGWDRVPWAEEAFVERMDREGLGACPGGGRC